MTIGSPNRRLREDEHKSGYKRRKWKAFLSDDPLMGVHEESYKMHETKGKTVYIHVVPNDWLVAVLFCDIFPMLTGCSELKCWMIVNDE
jgi:hypothetical protein